MPDGILYCLNINWTIPFQVRSRSPGIFKMKVYLTTVNNRFQPLPIFDHKKLHLRLCIGFEWNIVTWSTKILKAIWGTPLWSRAILGKYETLTLLHALKIHSQMIFGFRFTGWTKWSYYQFIDAHRFWLCYKFQCSILSKGTLPFDFIKYNLIRKLAYKVKSWSHNWERLTTCQSFFSNYAVLIQQLY